MTAQHVKQFVDQQSLEGSWSLFRVPLRQYNYIPPTVRRIPFFLACGFHQADRAGERQIERLHSLAYNRNRFTQLGLFVPGPSDHLISREFSHVASGDFSIRLQPRLTVESAQRFQESIFLGQQDSALLDRRELHGAGSRQSGIIRSRLCETNRRKAQAQHWRDELHCPVSLSFNVSCAQNTSYGCESSATQALFK